jgi:streptogramin lyase
MTLSEHEERKLEAARDTWAASGIFHPHPDDDDEEAEGDSFLEGKVTFRGVQKTVNGKVSAATVNASLLHQKQSKEDNKQQPQKEQIVTFVHLDAGGTVKVTAEDYPMLWEHKKRTPVKSTHELTLDKVNGFDKDFIYVSGMSVDQIARVSVKDPTRQQIFHFPKFSQPHTLLFPNIILTDEKEHGMLWVGLEYAGKIVKLDMKKLLQNQEMDAVSGPIPEPITIRECDYIIQANVMISASKASGIPKSINPHPHGFCFDADYKHIWFTGKLTNTVGRISVSGEQETLRHYQLPTLGAVPIYVVLGPDKNVWGTCLSNNMIYRVKTGDARGDGPEDIGLVTELPITRSHADRRPIAIKPVTDSHGQPAQFMWFSTEQGHSVCRVDIMALEHNLKEQEERKRAKQKEKEERCSAKKDDDDDDEPRTAHCVCSVGCRSLFQAQPVTEGVITEFSIPMLNKNMKMGGLAIDGRGELWTQSYHDPVTNQGLLPDYVIKVGKGIHDPKRCRDGSDGSDGKKNSPTGNMTGVSVEFYELPSRDTVLHRIITGPDDRVWFTELRADRIGSIQIVGESSKKRKRDDGEPNSEFNNETRRWIRE